MPIPLRCLRAAAVLWLAGGFMAWMVGVLFDIGLAVPVVAPIMCATGFGLGSASHFFLQWLREGDPDVCQ